MEAQEEISFEDLRAGLKKVRSRRWFLWVLILAYLPLMMIALRSGNPGRTVVIFFAAWILLIIVAVALMALVRCPRCGNCFHMSGYLFRPVRHCFTCGLHLTTDKKLLKERHK
jgi:Flp pilus assembly protein TadB